MGKALALRNQPTGHCASIFPGSWQGGQQPGPRLTLESRSSSSAAVGGKIWSLRRKRKNMVSIKSLV